MSDPVFFYVMVIKSTNADFDIKSILDKIALEVMGQGANVVTVLPDPKKAEESQQASKPLYKVRVTKESIARNKLNQTVRMVHPGDEFQVYEEIEGTGEYRNRLVISPPGAAMIHIYKPNTEKVT